MRRFKSRKGLAALVTLVVVAAGAIGAYAYFSGSGTGTGSANVAGAPAALTISQIGAGYNSLIPNNVYSQDQCFSCAGPITELGNDITLANPGAQQLVSVVVAFRNWNGNAITGLPITLSINNTVGGPISDTEHASFPAAIHAGSDPSTTNVTFDFSSQGAFVDQEFVYGITFDPSFDSGAAEGLNVALSSSANNLSVGTDTTAGTIYMNIASDPGSTGDFPSCTSGGTLGSFSEWTTDGCSYASGNPGAYGTPAQVAAGSADIPAVEVNVVGGVVTGLSPGGPSQPVDFAITNSGSSNVHLNQVYTTATSVTTGNIVGDEGCATNMFEIDGSPVNGIGNVPPGTTLYAPSGTTIKMLDDGNNQDNCEGAVVTLGFSTT